MRNSLLMSVTATVVATAAVLVPSPGVAPAGVRPSPVRPAIEAFHPVVREPAARTSDYAADYTVYRPADLDRIRGRLPVVVVGNGACRHRTNLELLSAETLLATHGFFADGTLGYGREHLANLHSPVLFLDGGPDDVAFTNSTENVALVTVPAVHATNPAAGHVGFWYGLRGGNPDYTLTVEAVTVLTHWLDFTLNGNPTARAYFLGQGCGLCVTPGWTVTARNFGA